MENDQKTEYVGHDETIILRDDEKVKLLIDIGEVKRNTEALNRLVMDTQGLVKDTRLGIYITIALSITAILLSAAAILVSIVH